MMNDTLIRGLSHQPPLRFAFADTTALCRDGIIAHDADPAGGAVLSEVLTVAALTAVLLEGEERYSFRYGYRGAAGILLADVNARCDVRGLPSQPHLAEYAHDPDACFGKEDALISVVKSENGKVLNSGQISCGMASPAGDASMFFSMSDQIETEFAVEVQFRPDPSDPVAIAAGFMLQAMPGCNLEEFSQIREVLHTPEFRKTLLDREQPLEKKLRRLLTLPGLAATDAGNVSYQFAATPGFRCSCCRESMKRALLTLPPEERKQLFSEKPALTVSCQFCRKSYSFTADDFPES